MHDNDAESVDFNPHIACHIRARWPLIAPRKFAEPFEQPLEKKRTLYNETRSCHLPVIIETRRKPMQLLRACEGTAPVPYCTVRDHVITIISRCFFTINGQIAKMQVDFNTWIRRTEYLGNTGLLLTPTSPTSTSNRLLENSITR